MPRSIEQIKNDHPKVADLRKEASRIKRENNLNEPLKRDGYEIQIGKGRKDELIEYISKLESLIETSQSEQPKPEPVEEMESTESTETTETAPQIAPDSDYSDSEQEKLFIAKKLYKATQDQDDFTGLYNYHRDFCRIQKEFSSELFGKFGVLVAQARIMIEKYANGASPNGEASPGGMIAIKVEIMKFVKAMAEADKGKFDPVLNRNLMNSFDDFDNAVRAAFKPFSQEKHRRHKEKQISGEKEVRNIKIKNFINWAKDTVSNLPENKARWKEVCIAIMLLTGRRQSEVMSSGLFEYVNNDHVIFEGQLKRHTEESISPTKIPVLGGMAQQIIDAIKWLEEGDKRTIPSERTYEGLQKAAKESHSRCSRYISETMAKLVNLVEFDDNSGVKSWKDNRGRNTFKGHLTRQIYAQVCAKKFKPESQKRQSYIAEILLENRDAAPNYDRDIEVMDKISNIVK